MEHADFASGSNPSISEDEYARQIWEEMNKRHHEARRPSAATADTWGKADAISSHAQRMRDAAKEAEERSRKILEEEEAKDRAWRKAVAQVGQLPTRACICLHKLTTESGMWLLMFEDFQQHDVCFLGLDLSYLGPSPRKATLQHREVDLLHGRVSTI